MLCFWKTSKDFRKHSKFCHQKDRKKARQTMFWFFLIVFKSAFRNRKKINVWNIDAKIKKRHVKLFLKKRGMQPCGCGGGGGWLSRSAPFNIPLFSRLENTESQKPHTFTFSDIAYGFFCLLVCSCNCDPSTTATYMRWLIFCVFDPPSVNSLAADFFRRDHCVCERVSYERLLLVFIQKRCCFLELMR